MNIIKNKRKAYNFGVASAFSKVLLKRATEKLNPNKVVGVVSNFAKQYLNTFSNWTPSMGISDDLRKYQLPLPVGVYEAVPDSAGLTRAEWENKLFDEALKNAIIEINEGITPEVKGVSTTFHFAEEKTSGALDVTKSEPKEQSVDQNDTNGGGLGSFIDFNNPAHVAALTGLTSSAISYMSANKKKRESGEAWKDAAIAGLIGGGAGYFGSKFVNSNPKQNSAPTQEQSQIQPSQPQEQQPQSATPKRLKPAELYEQETQKYRELAKKAELMHREYEDLLVKANRTPAPFTYKNGTFENRDEAIRAINSYYDSISKGFGLPAEGLPEGVDPNSLEVLLRRFETLNNHLYKNSSNPKFNDEDHTESTSTTPVGPSKSPSYVQLKNQYR